MFGQFGRAGRLAPQVELAIGPALEIGDDQPRAQPCRLAAEAFEMRSGPFISADIARKAFAHAGAQHFHCDLPAVIRHRAVDLRDRRRPHGHGIEIGPQRLERLLETGFDARLDLFEIDRGKIVLQGQEVARGILADEVGPRGQRLPQLDRGGADIAKGAGIVGLFGLHRAETGNPREPLDLRRGVGIVLDPAQRPVARQRAAPLEQAQDMRRGACHPRPSTPNGCSPPRRGSIRPSCSRNPHRGSSPRIRGVWESDGSIRRGSDSFPRRWRSACRSAA